MSKEHNIYSAQEARILWRTSWISAPAAAIQYFYQREIATITFTVLCTSLLYWYKPTYGWRRNTDIACVVFGLLHNMYCAQGAEYASYYYIITALGVKSYILSLYYLQKGQICRSIYIHSCVHLFANLANTILALGHLSRTPIVHLLGT